MKSGAGKFFSNIHGNSAMDKNLKNYLFKGVTMKPGKKMLANIALLSTLSLAAFYSVPTAACADEVEIAIAPGVLVVDAETDCTDDCDYTESLTVHAEISYASVCEDDADSDCSVDLCYDAACLASTAVFADSRGDLVAKFPLTAVIDMLPDAYNEYYELTLAGDTFFGTDEIYLKKYSTTPAQEPIGPMGPGTHSSK
jgi:hypothetical protein